MNIRLKDFYILLLGCLFGSFVFAADASKLSELSSVETFTLNQLSKIDTAVLEGNKPSYTFYIPVPEQWQVNSLDLNLLIEFSPLLQNASSLTLMVGDTPVESMQLDNTKDQPVLWKMTIPKNYITPKITTVRLVAYLKLSNQVCEDAENPGNWVTLAGNSTITYHFTEQQKGWGLKDFPYPFIHKDAPFPDKISFYLPNELKAADFAPYFNFSNVLAKEASWRGVEIDAHPIKELFSSDTKRPKVIIGTPKSIDFSLLGTPELLQLKNATWVKNDGTPLHEKEGFIWLRTSGQSPTLVISANNQDGLLTAVEAINSRKMHFMVNNPYFFIAEPLAQTTPEPKAKTKISFKELGYNDAIIFGSGQSQLNYQFNLSAQYANQPVKLLLSYSHSPFLQKDKASTISISVNGFPVDGAVLQPNSAQTNRMEVDLPAKQLKMGKNTITVTFTLILSEAFCTRDYLSQAWGTVDDNSTLQFSSSDTPPSAQIKSYPALMDGDVLLVLPADPSVYQDQQLIKSMIDFSMMLTNNTSLKITDTQSLNDNLKTHNLVYLDAGVTNSPVIDTLKKTMSQLTDNLNTTSNPTLRAIDNSIFINAFSKIQDVGFINIRSPETKAGLTQLILYGYSPRELGLALGLLNDSYKLGLLTGNLAVAFQNGTFTSLSSGEIEENVQKEIAMKRASELTVYYILGGFAFIVLILLSFWGWRRWRKKQRQ
ncbi:cellulose biosynthesis cyclic di-GMP-binding regulatory protein BcsB [Legionella worsleiensis]|uniref:Cyclic di-GMP-binding protein n=1 Tax=Legionella worsleiensis TaxID=45076 RepID=A0A0W1AKY8_9GAMM|nr:cellulose biosynthesis cyclic di-GMP-binding regulatory protein BcsB [Legionella worsleiensis]KTD81904.1 cellulose synthase regulator protein [Legionella worsleiensis]STY31217.1 cellulose synthase regulator protein [Legionella worsleiensis]